MPSFLFVILLSGLLIYSQAESDTPKLWANGRKVLVLLDNWAIRETHSTYFKMLREKGYELTFKMADDKSLTLTSFGEYLYSHLIIFAPSVQEFGGRIDVKTIQDFIDNGAGNLLITGSTNIGDAIRELGSECGVELGEEKTFLLDHQNYDANLDDGKHNVLVADPSKQLIHQHGADLIVGPDASRKLNPLLYRGVSVRTDPENPLVFQILRGTPSSYSFNPGKVVEEFPTVLGTESTLIAALQARNNARILVVGSLDFFSDEFFFSGVEHATTGKKWEKSGNEELAVALSEWLLKERGVLRVGRVAHHKLDPKLPPGINDSRPMPQHYTILEEVDYSIEIFEYVNHNWVPFKANDVQIEFVRIDPFIRKTLLRRDGHYYLKFKLPDVYGVFKFQVDYKRLGYTNLFSSVQVPVRPLQHTQYERFIFSAAPYYLSAFSMVVGLLVFSFLFLYHRDRPAAAAETPKSK